MTKHLVILFSALTLLACSPESPKLNPVVPPKDDRIKELGNRQEFNAKADILFVIDNSYSMEEHQANLIANIRLFTNALSQNQVLDYNIGVVSSSMRTGHVNGSMGRLYGRDASSRVISRSTPDGLNKLRYNLRVGTDGDTYEEFFSPVMRALSDELLQSHNKGFFRRNSHLAIIFITDTEDQSKVTPRNLYDFLMRKLGGDQDRLSVYAAYVDAATPRTVCKPDDPQKGILEEFFRLTNASTFGLCDQDFGAKVAELGNSIFRRSISKMTLSKIPDIKTIHIQYGGQIIPMDAKAGWSFDPTRNAIIFGDEIEWTEQPEGTQLEVSFDAADFDGETPNLSGN